MMNKHVFMQRMQKSRRELEAALAELTREQILLPGASGDMSVKDMLAHITWHEVQMVGMIEQMALTGSPWWTLPTDERNARIFKASQGRTWEDVRAEADAVYARLCAALEMLDEAAYQDAALYREMPPDWKPWRIFADNTYDHYDHHLRDIINSRLGGLQKGDK
jgi:uncharacterized damage-inducible protein DinB